MSKKFHAYLTVTKMC